MRETIFLITSLAAMCLAGCSDGLIEVTGDVSFDGEPVELGTIRFVDTGDSSTSHAADIKDGSYTLRTTPGSKRVEIRASRPLPPERQTQPEMGLMYDDYIPAQYNRESTLTADVRPDGSREFDFHLPAP